MTAKQIPSPYTDNGTRRAGTGPSQVLDGDFIAAPDPAPVEAADNADPAPAPKPPAKPVRAKMTDGIGRNSKTADNGGAPA